MPPSRFDKQPKHSPPRMPSKGPPDWRLQAWSTLTKPFQSADIGHTFPVGADVVEYSYVKWGKRFLGIAVPNGTAIFLNLSRIAYTHATAMLHDSTKHKSRGRETVFTESGYGIDWTEQMAASVIFAFTALEAFANEMIPEDLVWRERGKNGEEEEYDKERIERSMPLDKKLASVLPQVLSCASPKGAKVWDSYVELRRVRHRLIHLKDRDRHGSRPDADTVWGMLVSLQPPHKTALSMIDRLLKKAKKTPNWRRFYPYRDK